MILSFIATLLLGNYVYVQAQGAGAAPVIPLIQPQVNAIGESYLNWVQNTNDGKNFLNAVTSLDTQTSFINNNLATGTNSSITQAGIDNELKQLENEQEEISIARQNATTNFQNLDQETNNLFNTLSTVLQNEQNTESSVERNLGL